MDIKHNWELEMNTIISNEKWEQACRDVHTFTNSPVWNEFEWKVKMRCFNPSYHFKIQQHFQHVLVGLWFGGRPYTYILGLSKMIYILA